MEQLNKNPNISVEIVTSLQGADLIDLCSATEVTASDDQAFTIGRNRTGAQMRERLEKYWKGVLLVPNRILIVGRLDRIIAGSIQLVYPNPGNETTHFVAHIENHFVAPWGRGFGLAARLLQEAEKYATAHQITLLKLSVRASQESAIALYESVGYKRWGELENYEMVGGTMFSGYYYCKNI